MMDAKSESASQSRMALLKPRGTTARPRADVLINVKTGSGQYVRVVSQGHLDEVQELCKGGAKLGDSGGGLDRWY
jgi:hypothetical protein